MYITYVVYALLLGLLIWGGKFAGFSRNSFHEDSFSLDISKSLTGFAAICVIIYYIAATDSFQLARGEGKPGELALFLDCGFLIAAVFFFCSGFGLIKSLNTKQDYFKGYIKRRILKPLVVPFYISSIIYVVYLYRAVRRYDISRWVLGFLGFINLNPNGWYIFVALILYLEFYLVFKNVKNRKNGFIIMAVLIVLQAVIFCVNGHFAWWTNFNSGWWLTEEGKNNISWWQRQGIFWFSDECWVNATPAFLIGMLVAQYEDKFTAWVKKGYWIKLAAGILLTIGFFFISNYYIAKTGGYWTEGVNPNPGILNKFITYLTQIPVVCCFVLTVFVFMMKFHAVNPVLNFFGKISFATYVMSFIIIEALRMFIVKAVSFMNLQPFYKEPFSYNLYEYFGLVFVGVILLGLVYKYLYTSVNELIDGKKE